MSSSQDQPEPADDNSSGQFPGPAPGVIDERVAANVRASRERLGMSQADLAEEMAAHGWKFHAQTVYRIEAGQRKVTVGEAEALARILRTNVTMLSAAWGEEAELAMVQGAIIRIRQAWQDASDAVVRLEGALQSGELGVVQARKSQHQSVHDTADALEEQIEEATVQSAFEDGLYRWEQLKNGEGDKGANVPD